MWDKLLELIERLSRDAIVRALLVAFIFSFLVSGVVSIVLHVINPLGGSSGIVTPGTPFAYVSFSLGLFLAMFFALTFIVYVSLRSDLDDYYSWLRKKLVGIWRVELDTYRFEVNGTWTKERIGYLVEFYFIDRSKKLRARLEQSGSDIFEDADFKTSIVHIGEDKDDNYVLVILFEARQALKKEF